MFIHSFSKVLHRLKGNIKYAYIVDIFSNMLLYKQSLSLSLLLILPLKYH